MCAQCPGMDGQAVTHSARVTLSVRGRRRRPTCNGPIIHRKGNVYRMLLKCHCLYRPFNKNCQYTCLSGNRLWRERKMDFSVAKITQLPNSRSNKNKNQIKPKIWRGSIIAWLFSCLFSCHTENSSNASLAFEDAH